MRVCDLGPAFGLVVLSLLFSGTPLPSFLENGVFEAHELMDIAKN